jgi:hypothetical protein
MRLIRGWGRVSWNHPMPLQEECRQQSEDNQRAITLFGKHVAQGASAREYDRPAFEC